MLPRGSRGGSILVIWSVLEPPGLLKASGAICPKMFLGTNLVQKRAFEASPGWFCMMFQRASFLHKHIFQKSSNFNDSAPDESSGRVDAGIRHGIAIRTRLDYSQGLGTEFSKNSNRRGRRQGRSLKITIVRELLHSAADRYEILLLRASWSILHSGSILPKMCFGTNRVQNPPRMMTNMQHHVSRGGGGVLAVAVHARCSINEGKNRCSKTM